MKIKTVNPSNEEILAEYDIMSKEILNEKVRKSRIIFEDWKKNAHYRSEIIHQLADDLRKKSQTSKGRYRRNGQANKGINI